MPGYAQTERTPQQPADRGATERQTAERDQAPSDDALATSLNRSPASQSLLQMRKALDESPRVQALTGLQRALNRTHEPDDISSTPIQKKANATGLPDQLKAGVESLSGLAMDDVRVHYNSAKPAAVQAHAYAQGSDIHVAPGQEQHLPHEAWHVVQQKQGRVKPTLQLKGVAINDDAALEREADVMGRQAEFTPATGIDEPARAVPRPPAAAGTAQRIIIYKGKTIPPDPAPKQVHRVPNLEYLIKSEEKYDLDKLKDNSDFARIAEAGEQEKKKQSNNLAEANKDAFVARFIKMQPHMAGEDNVKGGIS